jgi:hypothetical protein
MKYLNENPKKPYTQATSLSEIDQKATKCGIGLGKCLCELADELRKDGKTPEPVSKRVSELTGVPHDRVEPLGRIYRWYRAPKTAGLPVFEWYYLYRVELAVLDAFIPVLRHHLERVRKGLGSNVWLTKNSIEIELDSNGGGKAWYDLKELSLEKVVALSATVNSPPVSAGSPQVTPPVAVSHQSAPVAVSQVEVSPAVIPTVVAEVATETLVRSDSTSTASDIESGCMSNIEDGAVDSFDNFDWDDANS